MDEQDTTEHETTQADHAAAASGGGDQPATATVVDVRHDAAPRHEPDDGSASRKPNAIALVDGLIEPGDNVELWRMCQMYVEGGMLPRQFLPNRDVSFRAAVGRTVFAHQLLTSTGLNPWGYMRFIDFINDTPVLWGDLPLTMALKSGRLDGLPDEYYIDADGTRISLENRNFRVEKFAAVCDIRLVGSDRTYRRMWTLDDTEVSGLVQRAKPGTPWRCYPTRMMQMRARGWALKDFVPDALCGVKQLEYDTDANTFSVAADRPVPHERSDRKPVVDLNDAFSSDEGEDA